MPSGPLLASILMLTTFGGNNKDKPSPNTTSMQGLVTTTKPSIAQQLTLLVNTPTFKISSVKVYSRTGYHLVVLPGGHVMGTVNSTISNKYGTFELQSFAPSVIRMKNTATNLYIGISSTGQVFSTNLKTNETLLKETQRENYFHSFHSQVYEDKKNKRHWYLAINRKGRIKNARKVLPGHKSFQFLTIQKPSVDKWGQKLLKFGIIKLLGTLKSNY